MTALPCTVVTPLRQLPHNLPLQLEGIWRVHSLNSYRVRTFARNTALLSETFYLHYAPGHQLESIALRRSARFQTRSRLKPSPISPKQSSH